MSTEELPHEGTGAEATERAARHVPIRDIIVFWAIGAVFLLVTGAVAMVLFFGFVASLFGG